MKIGYHPPLTGIRAFAAFIVLLHHLFAEYFEGKYINALLREFNAGVNIFFVLSGFLIWHRYSDNISLDKNWLKKYLLNRVARIYPVYILWTSIVLFLGYFAYQQSIHSFVFTYILNITFLKGFSTDFVYSGISQGWTLSVEELFYLSAPLLIILNLERKIPLPVLGLLIISLGTLLYVIFHNLNFHGFFTDFDTIRITTYFGRFTEFFAGIYLAKYLNYKKHRTFYFPVFTIFGSLMIVISIFIILPAFQTENIHYSIQSIPGYLFNVLLFPLFVAIFFYGLITEITWLSRFFGSNPLILLGKSSYALYLVHWGMTSYLIHRFISTNVYVVVILTYILSIVLWKYFEEPLNKHIRNISIAK